MPAPLASMPDGGPYPGLDLNITAFLLPVGGPGAMLVLTRKTNQSIMIGDDIEVSILSVAGDKVRVGIDAPRDIAVFRREVYDAIDDRGAGNPGSAGPTAPVERAE